MKAKVENRNFTEDLTDKSSPAFLDFEKEFKEQMREVYKDIEGYQDVVIHELRCTDEVAFWYQDKFCSSRVSKMGVAIGVPVATLVAAVAIFTVFMVRARRQKDEYRQADKLTSRLDLYCNVDENWNDDQGFAINNQGASWEATETPRTRIDLEKVDTTQEG
ncbi:hypothetical protein Q9966_014699 [Columba livia]|nr:hypothetical protein Q9966_014699 [Columba livia]